VGIPEDSPRKALKDVLIHQWYRPVLETLADGPRRYVDIRAALLAQFDPAPGEGQVNNTLRELASLGLVEKESDSPRSPWRLTESAVVAMEGLGYLDRLLANRAESVDNEAIQRQNKRSSAGVAGETEAPDEGRADRSPQRLAESVAELNAAVAHPARRYDYWLGGKDNFAADRESGDAIEKIYPHMRTTAQENRKVLRRIVRYLVAKTGVRQFLDIGTGLPTADNTHDVAQQVDPTTRIVYVDNDPLVLVHARALLTSHPDGKTDYLDADLRDPEAILRHPRLAATLDVNKPVALLLIAVLHFVPDTDQALSVVHTLLDGLPEGSYLAATHATYDFMPPETVEALAGDIPGKGDFTARTKAQFEGFFRGLDLVPPGVVVATQWRRDPADPAPLAEDVAAYAAVGRKP
jgi:DNA-binding HxlR family transcriptional regulator